MEGFTDFSLVPLVSSNLDVPRRDCQPTLRRVLWVAHYALVPAFGRMYIHLRARSW